MNEELIEIVKSLQGQVKLLQEQVKGLTGVVSDAIDMSTNNQNRGLQTIEMIEELTKSMGSNLGTLNNITSAIKSLDKRLKEVESFNSLSGWGKGKNLS